MIQLLNSFPIVLTFIFQYDASKVLHSTWSPAESSRTTDTDPIRCPPSGQVSKMDKLIELGFADRSINGALLKKHDGDVDRVIGELVSMTDGEWAKKRH